MPTYPQWPANYVPWQPNMPYGQSVPSVKNKNPAQKTGSGEEYQTYLPSVNKGANSKTPYLPAWQTNMPYGQSGTGAGGGTGGTGGGGSTGQPAQWGGGGGGGGGPAMPAVPMWAGAMNQQWLPWTDWSQTPWATLDPSLSAEGMQWMNTSLPWMQAYQQNQQWMNELQQRQAETGWNQQFQGQQFDWQQQVDRWTQAIQEQQLRDQMEQANLSVFGRRWRPNTRWA